MNDADSWPSFDQLKTIAKENPQALEEFKRSKIEALIARAPERYRRRLRGIQFQVDCTVKKHASPMGACISVSQMMQDSLAELNSALHALKSSRQPKVDKPEPRQSAQILPFIVAG